MHEYLEKDISSWVGFSFFTWEQEKTNQEDKGEGFAKFSEWYDHYHVTNFHIGQFIILLCLLSCEKAKENLSAIKVSPIDYSN